MKKLLLASDFSAAADYALEYAEWLCVQLNAQLVVLHVDPLQAIEEPVPGHWRSQLGEKNKAFLEQRLRRHTTPYPDSKPATLTKLKQPAYKVQHGRVVDEIIKAAIVEQADMIVIGSKSKHHFWDYLLGSVSTRLIAKSPKPVLIIPEGTPFKPIKEIAFASTIPIEEEAVFPQLFSISHLLKAQLRQFHVRTTHADQLWAESWNTDFQNGKYDATTVVFSNKFIKGIDYFLQQHATDWLAIYHPIGDHQTEFLTPKLRKELAYKVSLPLLILKEQNTDYY